MLVSLQRTLVLYTCFYAFIRTLLYVTFYSEVCDNLLAFIAVYELLVYYMDVEIY